MAPAVVPLDQLRSLISRQGIQPRHSAAQRNPGSRIPIRIHMTPSRVRKEALAAQLRGITALKEKIVGVLSTMEKRPAAQQVVRSTPSAHTEGGSVVARLQALSERLAAKLKEPLPWVEPHLGKSEVPLGKPGEMTGLPLPAQQKKPGKKSAGKKRVGFVETTTVYEGLPRWDKSCIDPESQKVVPTTWD